MTKRFTYFGKIFMLPGQFLALQMAQDWKIILQFGLTEWGPKNYFLFLTYGRKKWRPLEQLYAALKSTGRFINEK